MGSLSLCRRYLLLIPFKGDGSHRPLGSEPVENGPSEHQQRDDRQLAYDQADPDPDRAEDGKRQPLPLAFGVAPASVPVGVHPSGKRLGQLVPPSLVDEKRRIHYHQR